MTDMIDEIGKRYGFYEAIKDIGKLSCNLVSYINHHFNDFLKETYMEYNLRVKNYYLRMNQNYQSKRIRRENTENIKSIDSSLNLNSKNRKKSIDDKL